MGVSLSDWTSCADEVYKTFYKLNQESTLNVALKEKIMVLFRQILLLFQHICGYSSSHGAKNEDEEVFFMP